jgi:hypothetical protein
VLALIVTRPALAPTDPDYCWHARTGQLIVETSAVPRSEVSWYTAAGRPWIAYEWLTEVVFFVVQKQVGYVGNVVLTGLLGALAALALFATNLMPGWHDLLDACAVRVVLVDRDGALSQELLRDPAWHELYGGSVERLFERT